MIAVSCRTNLDLRGEQWPDRLPALPNIGDRIVSKTVWPNGFSLSLEVRNITWKWDDWSNGWSPEIELHMNSMHRSLPGRGEGVCDGSITAFYQWYAPLVGTTAGSFI